MLTVNAIFNDNSLFKIGSSWIIHGDHCKVTGNYTIYIMILMGHGGKIVWAMSENSPLNDDTKCNNFSLKFLNALNWNFTIPYNIYFLVSPMKTICSSSVHLLKTKPFQWYKGHMSMTYYLCYLLWSFTLMRSSRVLYMASMNIHMSAPLCLSNNTVSSLCQQCFPFNNCFNPFKSTKQKEFLSCKYLARLLKIFTIAIIVFPSMTLVGGVPFFSQHLIRQKDTRK